VIYIIVFVIFIIITFTPNQINSLKKTAHIIVFLFCQILLAQDPFSINYSINEGFPSITSYSAHTDKKGFLWFTTDVGVVKFDSQNFTLFNTDNGLSDNEVFQMKNDYMGRTWFLTLNGKLSYILNGKTYNETNSPILKEISGTSMLVDIYEDSAKTLYFFYKAGEIVSLTSKNKIQKSNAIIKSYYGGWINKNRLFTLSSDGIYDVENKTNINQIDSRAYNRIYHVNSENYYSSKNKLFKIFDDNSTKQIIEIPEEIEIINIYFENEFKKWICTRKGVYLYENNVLKNHYFTSKSISSIIKDFEGGYWLTTLKDGILYVPSFDVLNITQINNQEINKINCLSINKNQLWIGGNNNDVYVFKNGTFKNYGLFKNNRLDKITNIRFHNNNTYILTKNGIAKINSENKISEYKFNADDILFTSKNTFLGTTITSKFKTFEEIKPTNINSNSILKIRNNILSTGDKEDIWIGTNSGLYKYNSHDSISFWGKKHSELESSISELYFDNENKIVFVGSSSKGLLLIKNNILVQKITLLNGLNSNSVNAIKKIKKNQYLIATNNGLNLLYQKDNNYFTENFNSILGLKNKKINDIEIYNESLFLATDNGLIYFNGNNLKNNIKKPKCYIQPLSSSKITYKNNDVIINFKGISYINRGKLTYYYKFNHQDKNWSKTNETQINYKSLKANKYEFLVYSQNDNGIKSDVQKIKFEVLPPFWEKTWFKVLLFSFLGLVIYLFIKIRLQKQQKRFEAENTKIQLEKQMIELEQKALRMQMNPHFIFNALNTIKGYYTEGNLKEASSYISKFSKLLRKLLESEEQVTTLDNEIDMLKLYIELTQIRYEGKFDFDFIVDHRLCIEEILIPNLLLQPIVENAIIHGLAPKKEKGNLEIEFRKEKESLICIVDDNGVGRKTAYQKTKEYESKATDITLDRLKLFDKQATFEIFDKMENEINLGTKVIISIPIKHKW
jgi:sensor histidine kinase YesM